MFWGLRFDVGVLEFFVMVVVQDTRQLYESIAEIEWSDIKHVI